MANRFFIDLFKALDNLLEILCTQLGIFLDAFFFFDFVKYTLKVRFGDFHDNIGKHLNESAVAVVDKALIAAFFDQGFDHFVVEAEVQNGVHHSRHRELSAGTNRDKEWIDRTAKGFAGFFFEHRHMLEDFITQVLPNGFSLSIILIAGFCCDGESLRNRKANIGHLGKVGAFTS